MLDLTNEGLAPTTAKAVGKAVKSFFEANDVTDFNLKRLEIPKGKYNEIDSVSKDKIRQWYYNSGTEFRTRNQALIMLLKDCGLRVSDISALDLLQYRNAEIKNNEQGDEFKILGKIETKKTKEFACVIIGPEATTSLDTYLNGREDGPLFLNRYDKRLESNAISNIFFRLSRKLPKNGMKISAHSLRKFHSTELKKVINRDWVHYLEGKTGDIYNKPSIEELAQKYIDSYDKIRVITTESIKEKERDQVIEELKTKISKLEKQSIFQQPGWDFLGRGQAVQDIRSFFDKHDLTLVTHPEGGIGIMERHPSFHEYFQARDRFGNLLSKEEINKVEKYFIRTYNHGFNEHLTPTDYEWPEQE